MPDKESKKRNSVALMSRSASRVAEHASIREIRLFGTSAELKSFTSEGPLHWDMGITPVTAYKQGDQFFVVTIKYEITIEKLDDANTDHEDRDSENVADISFQFGILYELEQDSSIQGITGDEVEEYAKTAGTVILTPYAREYIHDVTMRMGLPPLVMDVQPSFSVEPIEPLKDIDQSN